MKLNVLHLHSRYHLFLLYQSVSPQTVYSVGHDARYGEYCSEYGHQSPPPIVQHCGVWSGAGEKYRTIPSSHLSTAKPSGHFFILCVRSILKEFQMYLKYQQTPKKTFLRHDVKMSTLNNFISAEMITTYYKMDLKETSHRMLPEKKFRSDLDGNN